MTVTPQDVRDVSFAAPNFFLPFSDSQIQSRIDLVTPWFSAPLVRLHSQREAVITWMVAHCIWVQSQAENAANAGGGGGFGPLSDIKLEGAAQMKFAVVAVQPADLADLLKKFSPYLGHLGWLIDTLPPSITITSLAGQAGQTFFPPLFGSFVL